jgi:hypothetical protein
MTDLAGFELITPEVLDVKGVFVAVDPDGRKQKILPADATP